MQKCCETQPFFDTLPPAVRRFKALHKESSSMQFRKDSGQDEKDMAFETFGAKTKTFSLDEREAFAFSRNDNFSSTQLYNPYGVGKLSISRTKTCNFSSVGSEKKTYGFR